MDEQQAIEEAAGLLRGARRVVALTGAGISTESGIPDFRGPKGVWTRDPEAEKRSTIQYYLSHPEARAAAWQNHLKGELRQKEPNAGHVAMAELHRKGKLSTLVTQNVDGLHQKGGFPGEHVIEIHGTVHRFQCTGCTDNGPIEKVLARVEGGEADPPCRTCGGILKSATISFGQQLVAKDLMRAETAASTCDVLLAVGTTLAVYPAAGMVPIALRTGARLIIMNAEETQFDEYASVVLRGQLGDVLPAVAALV
ncbi:MAG: SIR2 family NAD-dependent protein deacylase [Dehalococcoidia bacterium]